MKQVGANLPTPQWAASWRPVRFSPGAFYALTSTMSPREGKLFAAVVVLALMAAAVLYYQSRSKKSPFGGSGAYIDPVGASKKLTVTGDAGYGKCKGTYELSGVTNTSLSFTKEHDKDTRLVLQSNKDLPPVCMAPTGRYPGDVAHYYPSDGDIEYDAKLWKQYIKDPQLWRDHPSKSN